MADGRDDGEPAETDRLPDLLCAGLRLVVVGTAAGNRSAEIGCYYAGRGNRFWATLHSVGLTPRPLDPTEFRTLLKLGIGLTDVAKTGRGMDRDVAAHQFDPARLCRAIAVHRPLAIAFNGKKAASVALDVPANRLAYGRQAEPLAQSTVFVLPSTSGAASGYWNERYWRDIALFVGAPARR